MNKLITNEFILQRIKVTVKSFATFIALQVFEFWRIYGELWNVTNLSALQLLINNENDRFELLCQKENICTSSEKKFKDDVEFPLVHIKSSSCFIKEKEEGLDETCLFQTAWKEWDTEHQWSRTTNWYQQHKKQTKFIEDH